MSRTLPWPMRGKVLIFDSYKSILCSLLLELGSPFPLRGEAVHVRAVEKRLLRRADIAGLAAPGLQRPVLQRARVRESERPRQSLHRRHGVQVRGGRLIGLAAGKEHDARLRRGDRAL